MKITIDTEAKTLTLYDDAHTMPLYCASAFEALSKLWLQVGWNQKYPYTFSWLGFPILQIPEDMIRMAEVIWRLKPDLIIETGVAHGGSAIFYASLCRLIGNGHVIGIEKGLRCKAKVNRHPLGALIKLIEGDSVGAEVVDYVHGLARNKRVLVILDSNHSKAHVAAELEAYHDLIQPGSYIVATDGNMRDLAHVPRGNPAWHLDNPQAAAWEFAERHPEFEIEQPVWPFNESELTRNVTYWPNAWLKRVDHQKASGAGDKAVNHSPAASPDLVTAGPSTAA
jgi:cephalosporin hydroxylase